LEKLRILVVEDEPDIARSLSRVLKRRFKASVEVAEDSRAANDKLAQDAFDIVTLDYQMPDCDGLTVLEEIMKMPDAPPVVMVTGRGDEAVAAGAMRIGAAGYVLKDEKLADRLTDAIDKALTEKRLKKAEAALRKSEEQYRELVETANSFILKTDSQGNITFINKYGLEFFGYAQDELLGKNVLGTIVPDVDSEGRDLGSLTRDLMADPDRHRLRENENILRDGTRVWVSWSNHVMRDDAGRVIGALTIGNDITRRKRAEQELIRMNEELEGYAHAVSHDLRRPLASIFLGNEMLRNAVAKGDAGMLESQVVEAEKYIRQSVFRSYELIDDLLALAEGGQEPDSVEDIDVAEAVKVIVEELSQQIKLKRARVKIDDDMGHLVASRTHIYQVFSNLINNALSHNDALDPVVIISHLGTGTGNTHRYRVCDNGSGIPPENLTKIFTPFFKGSESSHTGIGLAIVDKVVKTYGGEVRAYNDNGACFEFSLADWESTE
jgi:PAS domain S-box-containing protein